MADHIYNAKKGDESYGGWKLINILIDDEGFKMGVYAREVKGKSGYTVANKGSSTANDWYDNIVQPFGESSDMKRSIAISKEFCNNHQSSPITFVGHSKGGAEAVANAVATNRDAIVFNPATAFLDKYDLSTDGYAGNVTSYVVDGEMLDSLSFVLGKNIGTEVSLESPYNYDIFEHQWVSLSDEDLMTQLEKAFAAEVGNFLNENIKKHEIDLVIELIEDKYRG